jgi:muramoyltetrapeptide carboxypeptidase LdcA involved in peptidoglycan recycling
MFFQPERSYQYHPYRQYCDGYLDWSRVGEVGKVKPLKCDRGWRFIQGSGRVEGQLFGGCIEVFEFLKGTSFWPARNFWNSKLLFLETSEEKPPIVAVKRMLRNYGIQGVFEKIAGVLFGRARDYSPDEKRELEVEIKSVIANEFGRPSLPVVTNMDFGHTDPQFVLPLGVKAELDCDKRKFRLVEPWLT